MHVLYTCIVFQSAALHAHNDNTVEPPNEGHFGNGSLSSLRRLSLSRRFTVFCIMFTMFKLLSMNKILFMLSVSESNSHVVLSDLLMHA